MQHASKQPQLASDRNIDTPDWVRDAVFYQIFPDRFAKSERVPKIGRLEAWGSPPTVHGYKGGDLLGVVDNLDYLQDLGVTALYFNPIFRSASNHRYHTHDYYQVDPMLGGNKALDQLLDACYKRDMKVVLDGVFNHASRGFFQFSDILENGNASPYRDWFHIRRFPLNPYGGGEIGYDAWWGLAALPKLNTANPEVREFLFEVAEYWLEVGIDGWRLDVPNEIND
ncbi:MAG: alpha-amylase family glycosyl hydrolase, partial [Deinococcota bacterium]